MRLLNAAVTLATIEESEVTAGVKTRARAEIYGAIAEELGEAKEHMSGVSSVLDHISMEKAELFHKTKGTQARGD